MSNGSSGNKHFLVTGFISRTPASFIVFWILSDMIVSEPFGTWENDRKCNKMCGMSSSFRTEI